MSEADQGWRGERQVTGPEHVEMPRTRRKGSAVPARLDAGTHDRAGIARMSGVTAELAPEPDPDVMDIDGQDGRGDPRSEGHTGLQGVGRDGFPVRPETVTGLTFRLADGAGLRDPTMVPA